MMGMRTMGRKAAHWVGTPNIPGRPRIDDSPGGFLGGAGTAAARTQRGKRRLMIGGGAIGGMTVLNASRSPSSGSDGMMPQSSGGMTGY